MSACWLASRKSVALTLVVLFAATLSVRTLNADAADKVARIPVVAVSVSEQSEDELQLKGFLKPVPAANILGPGSSRQFRG